MKSKEKTTPVKCKNETCNGCSIEGKLLCNHTLSDLIDFYLLFMVFFVPFLAGMLIGNFHTALGIWGVLAGVFFLYVEALILCRHCPHYAEKGFLLSCHANWGLPKIPKFNPRPLNRIEQVSWLVYVAVLFLFYIPFFIISQQWLMLGLTTLGLVTFGWTVQRTKCNRCYNLSCPVNRVPEDIRKVFYENYPDFSGSGEK